MVSAQFDVKHGCCGLCGKERPLWQLNLTAHEPPRLERVGPITHTGICGVCFQEIARVILRGAAPLPT